MITSTILKLTNFCNLNCSYCYMFNLGDKTFQRKPKLLSAELSVVFLNNVAAYMQENNIENYTIVLHGGEPSLWPLPNFKVFFKRLEYFRNQGLNIRVSLQTNGYLIPDELVKLCYEYKISLGISLDGPKSVNDKYRKNFSNKGSYDKIYKNVLKIINSKYAKVVKGFLVVVDPESDPIEILDWIETLPVTNVDLLWPIDYNHNLKPWQKFKQSEFEYMLSPRYGDWFFKCFEEWLKRDNQKINIRYFYEILQNYFGGRTHTDNIVNDTLNMFVVNTDGNYEYHDYFRSFGDGKVSTPFYIQNHSIATFSKDQMMRKLISLKDSLPSECKNCSFQAICGGGFLPGRMSSKITLNKKSILCYDHFYFFGKVNKLLNQIFKNMITAA